MLFVIFSVFPLRDALNALISWRCSSTFQPRSSDRDPDRVQCVPAIIRCQSFLWSSRDGMKFDRHMRVMGLQAAQRERIVADRLIAPFWLHHTPQECGKAAWYRTYSDSVTVHSARSRALNTLTTSASIGLEQCPTGLHILSHSGGPRMD